MSPTLTVRVSDSTGNQTVGSKTFQAGGGAVPLIGDVSGVVADAHIVGDLNLTGNVFSEGLLTGIDTFHVYGNGFTWFFQNGGRANLHGKSKGRWGPWGTDTTGWAAGDRLAIAPTSKGVYVPVEGLWTGDWATIIRPSNSPDVPLVNGLIAKPEVVNLSQSIVFENLSRGWHAHTGAGVFNVSDVKMLNCGTPGVLGNYPIHFHMCGDGTRGSLLERVIVEGGKNHAFVPHASHGISFPGCVAYNTLGPAFWWDPPPVGEDFVNDSEDINWDGCLALWVKNAGGPGNARTAGFFLGSGVNVSCVDSVAACVFGNPAATGEGNRQRSGFHWPEGAARDPWLSQRCVGHNNQDSGLLVWQNRRAIVNLLEDFTAYNNGYAGIFHGSYINRYHYKGAALTGNEFRQIAKSPPEGPMMVENVISDSPLRITSSGSGAMFPTYTRNCTFPSVIFEQEGQASWNVFEDCGLTPSDFDLAPIAVESIIEIKEGGVLTHRWQSGVWG